MFVRNQNGVPTEISNVFVRNENGQPIEIGKIYVRNENGIPVLVFDNTVIPYSCPTCGTNIPAFYYNFNGWNKPRFSNAITTIQNCDVINPIQGLSASQVPTFSTVDGGTDVTKNYWLHASKHSSISGVEEKIEQITDNLFTKKYELPEQCEFCVSVLTPPVSWMNTNEYWIKLNDAFNQVQNNPVLPGHIIVDWNSQKARDSIYVMMKPMKRMFNSVCTHPDSRCTSGNTFECLASKYCPNESSPNAASKYPFYQKPILMRIEEDPNDQENSYCGQERCGANLWGSLNYLTVSTCYGGWTQTGVLHLLEYPETISTNCNTTGGIGVNANVAIQPNWCGCCNQTHDSCCNTGCGCMNFYRYSYEEPETNPFSFIIQLTDHGTEWTIPTQQSGSTANDCCLSDCYGPVSWKNNKQACREVYRIPPINISPNFLGGPWGDKLGFLEDIAVSVLLNSDNSTLTDEGYSSSVAEVRLTLPCFVKLHDDLRARLVYIKEDKYNAFINGGSGPTDPREQSIWNAIKSVLGVIPGIEGNNALITDDMQRTWISSNSFYYNEYQWNPQLMSAPYNKPPNGITQENPNGYPTLWWSVKGYPTEESTHYVVFELLFSGSRCVSNVFSREILQDLLNQEFFVKAIRFYPLERACLTTNYVQPTKYYKHPLFYNYIIPKQQVEYIDLQENIGMFDYYSGQTWQTTDHLLPDYITENNFWVYTDPVTGTQRKRCLVYPTTKTYANFYNKFHATPVV